MPMEERDLSVLSPPVPAKVRKPKVKSIYWRVQMRQTMISDARKQRRGGFEETIHS